MTMKIRSCVAAVVVALAGCDADQTLDGPAGGGGDAEGGGGSGGVAGSGGEGGSGGVEMVPERLVLAGLASGTMGDDVVNCDLEGELTDITIEGDDLSGTFVGEFLRRVEVGEMAFAFEPFLGGPATVGRVPGEAAQLRLVGDQPDDAKAYWLAIEVLEAEEVAPYTFEGSWSCAPLEIDGNPPDFTTTVTGTFTLAPP
jgi:hypothetical protein